jgi:hypothetical protein
MWQDFSPPSNFEIKNAWSFTFTPAIYPVQSSRLLLALASTVILGFGPRRTHGHIFVLSRLLGVLIWGLLFDERREVTPTGHSSNGEWFCWLSLSLTYSLSYWLTHSTPQYIRIEEMSLCFPNSLVCVQVLKKKKKKKKKKNLNRNRVRFILIFIKDKISSRLPTSSTQSILDVILVRYILLTTCFLKHTVHCWGVQTQGFLPAFSRLDFLLRNYQRYDEVLILWSELFASDFLSHDVQYGTTFSLCSLYDSVLFSHRVIKFYGAEEMISIIECMQQ